MTEGPSASDKISVGLDREVRNGKAPKVHPELEWLGYRSWWHVAN